MNKNLNRMEENLEAVFVEEITGQKAHRFPDLGVPPEIVDLLLEVIITQTEATIDQEVIHGLTPEAHQGTADIVLDLGHKAPQGIGDADHAVTEAIPKVVQGAERTGRRVFLGQGLEVGQEVDTDLRVQKPVEATGHKVHLEGLLAVQRKTVIMNHQVIQKSSGMMKLTDQETGHQAIHQ